MHKQLEDRYAKDRDVVLFHLQTVWEGQHTNTPERGPRETKKYDIQVPVGFDGHVDGARLSVFMSQFGTGGTPWSIVIDKKGVIRLNEVTPDAAKLTRLIDQLKKEKG